jgi:hypothetical protein
MWHPLSHQILLVSNRGEKSWFWLLWGGGGLIIEYMNIHCIFYFKNLVGGRIWLFSERFGLVELTPLEKIDSVVNIQSLGKGIFDVDDHEIDDLIITNKKHMSDFLQCISRKHCEKRNTIVFPLQTEILGSWGLVIYRWKGLVKIFLINKSQQQSFFTLAWCTHVTMMCCLTRPIMVIIVGTYKESKNEQRYWTTCSIFCNRSKLDETLNGVKPRGPIWSFVDSENLDFDKWIQHLYELWKLWGKWFWTRFGSSYHLGLRLDGSWMVNFSN